MNMISMLALCALLFAQDKTGNGDIVIGPDYQVDPDLKDSGNPKGQSLSSR